MCRLREVKKVEVYEYRIHGKKYVEILKDCAVPDCDEHTLSGWLKINKMFNLEYEKNKKIGEMLDAEFKKLDERRDICG